MNNTENTLLIELGTEELPPKDLQKLSLSLQTNFAAELTANQLEYREIIAFATPRRLAIQIHGIATHQQTRTIPRKGPSLQASFDAEGKPTSAALGFATSCKVTIEQLQKQETPKGSWLCFNEEVQGQKINGLLPGMLERALAKLPISKRMRWGDLQQSFVRPVHWLVLLLNNEVINATLFNIQADRYTYGHRFHHPEKIFLEHAKTYEQSLATIGMVIADFNKRLTIIKEQASSLATAAGGTLFTDNEELLDLIAGLVEYPVPLVGSFNQDYLSVPKEALIAAIQEHQKCLPIMTKHGTLSSKFILISNIKSTDPNAVIYGNELVMNARLADAAFLYKEDHKHALSTNLNKLKTVTFQANLGSLYDKTQRIEQLATLIAKQIGANAEHTARAATLCKADLVSQMVYEFPELQGIMGCYYAQNDEEPSAIGIAIKEHYLPKMAQDLLPASFPGICIALADRIDTLVGLFAIGKIPSGEKDPFALKRQALAVLRIIIEKSLSLDLQQLCQTAYNNYQDKVQNLGAIDKLIDFFFERLRYWYLAIHTPARIFEAVLAKRPTEPFDFHQRLLAVRAFQQLPAAESLAAANKRVKNIVDQAPKEIDSVIINETMLIEKAEKSLYENIQKQERIIAPLFNQAKYQDVLTSLVDLKEPIDLFFEQVMVMVEDETLKNNRLVLLQRLRKLFLVVADISLL